MNKFILKGSYSKPPPLVNKAISEFLQRVMARHVNHARLASNQLLTTGDISHYSTVNSIFPFYNRYELRPITYLYQ